MRPPAPYVVRAAVAAVGLSLLAAGAGWLPLRLVLTVAGLALVIAAGESLIGNRAGSPPRPRGAMTRREAVLDTSALIDARLVAIAESGFLDRTLLCPAMVLRELQSLADSPDASRRARGRRGLDALAALRKGARVEVVVMEEEAPAHDETVDRKLLAIAASRGAALVTTDFALNKLAAVRGVDVLNVNDLAHAVRPVVLPGERLHVTIVKEGKEPGQGVAYLEDGTMIVVEQGRPLIGRTLDVTITSALQTAAGKMLFAKPVV